jgi:hypothetical protein
MEIIPHYNHGDNLSMPYSMDTVADDDHHHHHHGAPTYTPYSLYRIADTTMMKQKRRSGVNCGGLKAK